MHDDELHTFKRDIDFLDYATRRHGYARSPRESSAQSHVLRHEARDDKLVVKRDEDGHWVYFSVRDDRDQGTIVDFVQRRTGKTLGQVREELRGWLGLPRPALDPATAPARAPSERPRVAFLDVFASAREVASSPYLQARGLRPETLRDPRFAGTFRQDGRGNVLFVHRDSDRITGFEIKNRDFTGFAPGGTKAAWQSAARPTDDRLVIAESAIDALSYHQQHRKDAEATRYLSTGGTPGRRQLELLGRILDRLPGSCTVIAAVDNDEAGTKLVAQLRELTHARAGLSFLRDSPTLHKDWNDVVQRAERAYIESLPHAVRALARERGHAG
jgi:hypothetical protein